MSTRGNIVDKLEILLTNFSDSADALFKQALVDELEKQGLDLNIGDIRVFTKIIEVILEKDGQYRTYRVEPCINGYRLIANDGGDVIEFKQEITSQTACVAMTAMSTFSSYYC